ncbi:MAG: hypothetical protein H5T98_00820 [Syntrophomonadaceae bacterium]|nr:hypothetical protein [Syntrophomonadaceae bacterium]
MGRLNSKNEREIIIAINAAANEKPRPLHKYETAAITAKFKKARWGGLQESLDLCAECPSWRAMFLAQEV